MSACRGRAGRVWHAECALGTVKARLATRMQARARGIKSSPAHMYWLFDLVCAPMHARPGRLGRREFDGVVGEAVERALMRRPSPPAEARYVEGNQLAVGGAKGFRGRAEATRCICSLHRHRPCAGSLGRARGAHSHRRHAQAKLGTLRTSVAND